MERSYPGREMEEAIKTAALQEWQLSLTGFYIKFAILTVLLIGIFVALLVTGSIKSVADNWSRYRCNPLLLPFSEMFGYDSAENFQYCVRTMMQEQSGEFFQPVYSLLGQYSSSLGMIVNTVAGFRKTLGNFKLSTDSFIGSVMAKIQALMFQVRMTFLKMQTLMGRVYGTMYSIIWMGTSSITAGMNLADNDLVNFMFEFCFAPTTQVKMADGSIKEIQTIQVGDLLEGNVRVTSTFVFDGSNTPMVRIGEDVLSAQHLVRHGAWIDAAHHPQAIPTKSLDRLICLNVTGHVFQTAAGLVVADYDESSDPSVLAKTQQIAQTALNGSDAFQNSQQYELGLDPRAEIRLLDSWKPLANVEIGDVLYGGAKVCGIVQEDCRDVFVHQGLYVSGAQLVWDQDAWVRAETLGHRVDRADPAVLFQLVTDRAGPLFFRDFVARDYREAPLPEMEEPYAAALKA
jgi:hypothetical protein